eukprot:8018736-Heterocapsa_arctica.AAC.1
MSGYVLSEARLLWLSRTPPGLAADPSGCLELPLAWQGRARTGACGPTRHVRLGPPAGGGLRSDSSLLGPRNPRLGGAPGLAPARLLDEGNGVADLFGLPPKELFPSVGDEREGVLVGVRLMAVLQVAEELEDRLLIALPIGKGERPRHILGLGNPQE